MEYAAIVAQMSSAGSQAIATYGLATLPAATLHCCPRGCQAWLTWRWSRLSKLRSGPRRSSKSRGVVRLLAGMKRTCDWIPYWLRVDLAFIQGHQARLRLAELAAARAAAVQPSPGRQEGLGGASDCWTSAGRAICAPRAIARRQPRRQRARKPKNHCLVPTAGP